MTQGDLLIQDARYLLNYFAGWSVKHVKWKANEVAHRLAKDATNLDGDLFEIECIPKRIIHTIILNCC